jgi:hypothetical protein
LATPLGQLPTRSAGGSVYRRQRTLPRGQADRDELAARRAAWVRSIGCRGFCVPTGVDASTPISFGMTEHQGSHKVWGTQLDAQARYQVLELE